MHLLLESPNTRGILVQISIQFQKPISIVATQHWARLIKTLPTFVPSKNALYSFSFPVSSIQPCGIVEKRGKYIHIIIYFRLQQRSFVCLRCILGSLHVRALEASSLCFPFSVNCRETPFPWMSCQIGSGININPRRNILHVGYMQSLKG